MQAKAQTRDIFAIKAKLEKIQIVKDYLGFDSLSYQMKQKIWNEWNQYYENVKKTVLYAMFQEQKEALKKENMAKVHELQRDIQDMREKGHVPEFTKPHGIDPMTFYHDQSVLSYKRVLTEIKLSQQSDLNF